MDQETLDPKTAATELEHKHPREIIAYALSRFANIAISFSGAEDVVLLDMASKVTAEFQVFSLDTGRLPPETHDFFAQVAERYQLKLDLLFPDADSVERLVREKGINSFYRDGHQECCGVRKVAPLRRKLASLDAWITGQRRDQSPETRNTVPTFERDQAFSRGDQPLLKFNPLARWTSAQVWDYIREHDVPYNALHRRGYVSIGCAPCTRAILPNQHEREGRWWWEQAAAKECGLHVTK
jgi:phosphoadenosine phosphosulfate reductase